MKIDPLCCQETVSNNLMPYLGQWNCIYLTVHLVHSKKKTILSNKVKPHRNTSMYRKMDLMKVFKTYNDVVKVMFNDQATEITEKNYRNSVFNSGFNDSPTLGDVLFNKCIFLNNLSLSGMYPVA